MFPTAGNYLLSQMPSNCGGLPQAKDGYFTMYYTFNKIVLDVLMEKFHTQVEYNTVTQFSLLHNDISGYDLPALDFVSPSKESDENQILKEEDPKIVYNLENVLIHMIDEQDAQLFKSRNDYIRNQCKFTQYLKYAKLWQSASILCSYAAFLCDILLIVTFIVSFIKYCKTMQALLMAFISTNTSGIPQTKANVIGRTYPPLFTINLPEEEEQIIDDLDDIEGVQVTIQAISFFVYIVVAIIIIYHTCKRCRCTQPIVKYCFPFFLISRLLRGTCRTDLFVEVTNLMKGNAVWAHFITMGYYLSLLRISRQIPKEKVRIEHFVYVLK